ncbi:T-cell surface antigen CD2-like [Hoplias malabaricus]|uniref:T-cell surface antigen CD2-like n=1 Tax=Hoplias malabaricus TaxID=27720 RepID=UPI0034632FF4
MLFRVGAALLLVCVLFIFFIGDCSTCDYRAVVGGSVILQVPSSEDFFDTKWKYNDGNVLRKKNGHVYSLSQRAALKDNGSLQLTEVKGDNAGGYTVECFDKDGLLKLKRSFTLCVYETVSKPRVNFTCLNGKPFLRCEVVDSKDLTFSWFVNGKKLALTGRHFSGGKDNQIYTCLVRNPVHTNTSDDVSV